MLIAFVGDFAYPFPLPLSDRIESVKKITNAKLVVGNLESSVISHTITNKLAHLYSTKALKEFILNQGIDIVSLANNHTMDYGKEGLQSLIDLLRSANVKFCGAGMDIYEALAPIKIEIEGERWAFISFGWDIIESIPASVNKAGVAPLDNKIILKNVAQLNKEGYKVCVILHWGYEYEKYPLPFQRKIAHELIDAGVEIIVGHHPHIPQGIEHYKGKLIAYSLGNFYLPLEEYSGHFSRRKDKGNLGLILLYNTLFSNNTKLMLSEYNPEDKSLRIRQPDSAFLDDFSELSTPLKGDFVEYCTFLKQKRDKRRLLPLLTGGIFDSIGISWLYIRKFLLLLLTVMSDIKKTRR